MLSYHVKMVNRKGHPIWYQASAAVFEDVKLEDGRVLKGGDLARQAARNAASKAGYNPDKCTIYLHPHKNRG